MQSSEDRPATLAKYATGRARLTASTVFMVFLAIIAIYLSYASFAADQMASAIAMLAFAVFAISACTFGWSNSISLNTGAAARLSMVESTVRYDARSLPLLLVVTASLATTCVAAGVATGGGPVLWMLASVGALLASFIVPVLITRTVRRGLLELTIKGCRHRAWAYEAEIVWTDVVYASMTMRPYPTIWVVVDAAAPLTRTYTTPFWRIEKFSVPHTIELDCRRFDVHPMVLLEWIRFYITTPAARVELGTEAAADRLAAIGI